MEQDEQGVGSLGRQVEGSGGCVDTVGQMRRECRTKKNRCEGRSGSVRHGSEGRGRWNVEQNKQGVRAWIQSVRCGESAG